MTLIHTVTILMCLSALFSYLNSRWIKLPFAIGLMAIALAMSLVLVLLGKLGFGVELQAEAFIRGIDFNETVMHGLLSFLLFAGSLHIKPADLFDHKWFIATLASAGVVLSTIIVGFLGYWLFSMVGLHLPLVSCLLFGALISSTDPIAVLSILKQAKVPKALEIQITGESLFNDGAAVAVFLVLMGLAARGQVSVAASVELFFVEVVGGVALGFAVGYVVSRMILTVDSHQVKIFMTLALVMGLQWLSDVLNTSSPIAVVVAGLLVGHQGRHGAAAKKTQGYVDTFWDLLDEIFNVVLFVLIGLEVLVLSLKLHYLAAGLIAVPIVLAARLLSVGLPVRFSPMGEYTRGTTLILTWGGLRGGVSVALALSLPFGDTRDALLTITYIVVAFSILVQGLTLGKVIQTIGVTLDGRENAVSLVRGA